MTFGASGWPNGAVLGGLPQQQVDILIALSWLLHQNHVTSVIVGAKSAEQLKDNLTAAEVTLTADELSEIDAVSKLPKIYQPGCGRYTPTAGRARSPITGWSCAQRLCRAVAAGRI